MTVTFNTNTGLGLRDPFNPDTGEGGSWFGKLWRNHIRPRIGTIVGLLIGGPVGALLGELIQQGVTVMVNGQQQRLTQDVDLPDSYPISEAEEQTLLAFIDQQLKPTVANLANSIDTVLNFNRSSRITNPVNSEVLDKANKVLQAISVIRAHNQVIQAHGERGKSANYVTNKVGAINITLNALEQATIQYLENVGGDYQLVSESFTASNTRTVESMILNWQGKTANTIKNVYVPSNTQLNPDQSPVEIVHTTTTTAGTTDVIVNSPNSDTATEIKESKKSLLKFGAAIAIGFGLYKVLK